MTAKAIISACQQSPRGPLLYFCDFPREKFKASSLPFDRPDSWVPDEPSTIWTFLEIKQENSPLAPPLAPSYRELAPGQRWLYLDWLCQEALRASVPDPYPFLFYYGLERKMFGPSHEQATGEILRLREILLHHHLFQMFSAQALVVCWLFHRQYGRIARWISDNQPTILPEDVTQGVAYFLLEQGIEFQLPTKWLLQWVVLAEPRLLARMGQLPAESFHERFSREVNRLFLEEPLSNRFHAAQRRLPDQKPSSLLAWHLANPSRPFQSLEPLALYYQPVFRHPAFVEPFVNAFRNSAEETARHLKMRKAEESLDQTEEMAAIRAWDEYKRNLAQAGKNRTRRSW